MHVDTEADEGSWRLAQRAFRAADKAKVDHVVVAGDLFDSASRMERDRDRVRAFLKRLGMWQPDRLSVVPGNHDVYHVSHRRDRLGSLIEMSNSLEADAQEHFDSFCEWVGPLVRREERLDGDQVYPFRKDLGGVILYGIDSTGLNAIDGTNGHFERRTARLLRGALRAGDGRRVLALHHPAYEDRKQTLAMALRKDFAFGFVRTELNRLRRFTTDAQIEALLCGHVHDFGEEGDPWNWEIGGRNWRCQVHCVGRTGGVHDSTPTFGILSVPAAGHLRWTEHRF